MPIKINSTGGGSVSIDVPSTGGTYTLTAPANNATIFTTAGGAITGNVAVTGVASFSSNVTFTSNNVSIGGQSVSPFTGMKNRIINGDMRVWQRATSFANTTTYTADRWFVNRNGGGTGVSASRSGSIGNYYLKVSRDSGTSATGALDIRQVIESLNCADLAGQTVTLSFVAYAGANFSAGNLLAEIRYSTAVDDNVNVVGSWVSGVISTITLTVTPTRYTVSYTLPANALTLMIRFYSGNYSGTAGADDSVYIDNVQLEPGPVATPFEFRQYGQELALCQRYCHVLNSTALGGENIGTAAAYSSGVNLFNYRLPVTMRTTPTITLNTASGSLASAGSTPTWSSLTAGSYFQQNSVELQVNGTTTAGYAYIVRLTSGIVAITAEL